MYWRGEFRRSGIGEKSERIEEAKVFANAFGEINKT